MNKENKSDGGKGDAQRKTDHQKYSENYEKIFRSKQLELPIETEKPKESK